MSSSYRSKLIVLASVMVISFTLLAAGVSLYMSERMLARRTDNIIKDELSSVVINTEDMYLGAQVRLDLFADDDALGKMTDALNNAKSVYASLPHIETISFKLYSKIMSQSDFSRYCIVMKRYIIVQGMDGDSVIPLQGDADHPPSVDDVVADYLSEVPPSAILYSDISEDAYLLGVIDVSALFSTSNNDMMVYEPGGRTLYSSMNLADGVVEYANGDYVPVNRTIRRALYGASDRLNLRFAAFYRSRSLPDYGSQSVLLFATICVVILVFMVVLRVYATHLTAPIHEFLRMIAESESNTDALERYMRRYSKDKRMWHKITRYFCTAMIPAVLILLINCAIQTNILFEQSRRTLDYGVMRFADKLGYVMLNNNLLLRDFAFDDTVQLFMHYAGGYLKDLSDTSDESLRNTITSTLFNKGIIQMGIYSVTIYDTAWNVLYTNGHTGKQLEPQQYRDTLSNRFRQEYWELGYNGTYMNVTYKIRNRNIPSIASASTAKLFETLGYVRISRSNQLFAGNGLQTAAPGGYYFLIDNDTGEILSAESGQPPALHRALPDDVSALPQNGGDIRIDGQNYLCYRRDIHKNDFSLIYLVPYRAILSDGYSIIAYNAILLVLLLTMSFSTALWFTRITLYTLYHIKDNIDSMSFHDNALFEISEFYVLAESFKHMLARLKQQESEGIELEKRKKEAQIIALQTQMDPHFLFNIFSSIHFLLSMREIDEAKDMVDATGRLFRIGMYRGNIMATLSEEIEHVRAYIRVQCIRFPGMISLSVDIGDTPPTLSIPKFTLQPVVENSIEHGLSDLECIHIHIEARVYADHLRIMISDNGVGVEPVQLEIIKDNIKNCTKTRHMGLANIHERIILFFGEQYGLGVDSTPGGGVTVHIRLPYLLD